MSASKDQQYLSANNAILHDNPLSAEYDDKNLGANPLIGLPGDYDDDLDCVRIATATATPHSIAASVSAIAPPNYGYDDLDSVIQRSTAASPLAIAPLNCGYDDTLNRIIAGTTAATPIHRSVENSTFIPAAAVNEFALNGYPRAAVNNDKGKKIEARPQQEQETHHAPAHQPAPKKPNAPPKEINHILFTEHGSLNVRDQVKPSVPPGGISSWVERQEALRVIAEEKRAACMARPL